jgi:hypothetical protein
MGYQNGYTHPLAAELEIGAAVNTEMALSLHAVTQVNQAFPLLVFLVASPKNYQLLLKKQYSRHEKHAQNKMTQTLSMKGMAGCATEICTCRPVHPKLSKSENRM